jgi:hypothetical protein
MDTPPHIRGQHRQHATHEEQCQRRQRERDDGTSENVRRIVDPDRNPSGSDQDGEREQKPRRVAPV